MKVLNKKKSYAEVAKVYGEKESFICEIVKEMCASFAVASQTAKVMATVNDKRLIKMENELILYNKIF